MPSEIEKSLLRLVLSASAHSQQYGLSGYSLGALSNEQVYDIGGDLVRLFEQCYEAEIKKASPGKSGTPSDPSGGTRARQRLRDQ